MELSTVALILLRPFALVAVMYTIFLLTRPIRRMTPGRVKLILLRPVSPIWWFVFAAVLYAGLLHGDLLSH